MRILIGWDNPAEADLLNLYLAADNNVAEVVATKDELFSRLENDTWDVLFLSLTFPNTADEGFNVYSRQQDLFPTLPVVIACRETEMMALPRFLTKGLRHYLFRDAGGNFVFLALTALEAAVSAFRDEEMRKLAERLREEMDGVRKLQESIIPRTLPAPSGYRVVARYEPSEVRVLGNRPVVMAGGDYYNVFQPDERTLVILLGDASGHGLKACMAIMTMHTLMHMIPGDRFRDTARFVTEINKRLCDNEIVQSEGGFITLFYAAIDIETHTMHWTSAGHPLPIMLRMASGETLPIGTEADGGLPLGITAEIEYDTASIPMVPGSRLTLYTDGLTDAFPMDGDARNPFGVNGIRTAMTDSRARTLEESLLDMMKASNTYTRGSGRHDDTTVVLVERSLDG